jgi:hypothetical protein
MRLSRRHPLEAVCRYDPKNKNGPAGADTLFQDTLHISLDVTANGQLPLPPLEADSPSQIFNITVFLYSYTTGRNFTVSNGTAAGEDDTSLGNIMEQEPGSTVKHINWVWPDCLVGDGQPEGDDSDRGVYNVSYVVDFGLGKGLTEVADIDPSELSAQWRRPLYHLRRAHIRHQQHRGER